MEKESKSSIHKQWLEDDLDELHSLKEQIKLFVKINGDQKTYKEAKKLIVEILSFLKEHKEELLISISKLKIWIKKSKK